MIAPLLVNNQSSIYMQSSISNNKTLGYSPFKNWLTFFEFIIFDEFSRGGVIIIPKNRNSDV